MAGQNEPEDIDPDVAAMMGFGGFGTSQDSSRHNHDAELGISLLDP
jgi:hypothetical protein